jgi:hypothetical protein
MINPNGSMELSPSAAPTVLDIYFAEAAKGPDRRKEISMAVCATYEPAQRLALQADARTISLGDLATGAVYAQSVLLLEYANQVAADTAYPAGPGGPL